MCFYHKSKHFFPILVIIISIFALPCFSEEEQTSEDEFSSFFNDAEDVSEPVITDEATAGKNVDLSVGEFKLPLEVSGTMTSEMGLGYVRKDAEGDVTGYFDFKNYLYFISRPDKYLALKGTIKSSLPADSSDADDDAETDGLEGQTNYFYIYELYFDYLMFNRLYITAGKKKTVWGNIRLFSDSEEYDGDEDALYTNILYDSRHHISGILKLPIKNHTFTALAMYHGGTGTDTPGTKDMSFAGSAEFVFFGTSLNLFGRRFPLRESELVLEHPKFHKNSIIGAELKRTIFGFDLYGQSLGKISDDESKSLTDVFTSKFDDLTAFNKIISTVGCYKMWMENTPYFGFNFEFQNIYNPLPEDDEKYFTNRFASYVGLAKLGPDKNISVGVQWNHNITTNVGFVKPGIVFSRVLPHCDLRLGAKYEYGFDEEVKGYEKKLTVGAYLRISMDY